MVTLIFLVVFGVLIIVLQNPKPLPLPPSPYGVETCVVSLWLFASVSVLKTSPVSASLTVISTFSPVPAVPIFP